MKRLLREPLVGFLLLGALIFWWEDRRSGPEPVVIDPAAIDKLVEERELVLERSLTPDERIALAQYFVDQEILLREAVELGLHFSDGRVRHRLSDKMMFLLADEPSPPDAQALEAYYEANRDRYYTERRVSFEHRFFGDSESVAREALAEGAVDDFARQSFFWLGTRMEQMGVDDLASSFGIEFASALEAMPVQEWAGPVMSLRGWHLVRILAWHPAQPIPREHLEERLRTEWLADRRDAARAAVLEGLRERYDVIYRGSEQGQDEE